MYLQRFGTLMAVILAAGLYLYSPGTDSGRAGPCVVPYSYRIGEIDERFPVSGEELREILEDVSDMWGEAAGTEVMRYEKDGDIVIHLVYAEEQQLSERERQVRDVLRTERQVIDQLEREYEQMNRTFDEQVAGYTRETERMRKEVDELNRWVVAKNENGGFTSSEFKSFEQRKKALDDLTRRLQQKAENLNSMSRELEQKRKNINKRIQQKNERIDQYNRTFAGTREFTQGTYDRRENGQSITIYYFLDRRELKRALAHEMGHALGIKDHVENPSSVMYHRMGIRPGEELRLSREDRRALREICGDTS